MASRAGPFTQLMLDLAFDPEFRSEFSRNSTSALRDRGFQKGRIDLVKKAVYGDQSVLMKLLADEEGAMEAIWGARPTGGSDDPATGWPLPTTTFTGGKKPKPAKPKPTSK